MITHKKRDRICSICKGKGHFSKYCKKQFKFCFKKTRKNKLSVTRLEITDHSEELSKRRTWDEDKDESEDGDGDENGDGDEDEDENEDEDEDENDDEEDKGKDVNGDDEESQ